MIEVSKLQPRQYAQNDQEPQILDFEGQAIQADAASFIILSGS